MGFRDNLSMRWQSLLGVVVWVWVACLSGCAVVVQYPLTSASAGVWGATGKGPTDHAVSNATGQDCDLTRVMDLQPVCQDRQPVQVDERAFRPVAGQ